MKKLQLLTLLLMLTGALSAQSTCTAGFTASISGGTVTFTNTSTGAPMFGGMATWTFGDGSSATTGITSGTSHTYTSNGGYVVCLTIADSMSSCYDTFCDSVVITGAGGGGGTCTANYTYSISGCDVSFTDGSSASSTISSWSWSFGDGTSSTSASPTHTFSGSGPWYVCLTIGDSSGCSDNFCQWISLPSCGGGSVCDASYYWFHDSTLAYTIILVNTSTGGPAMTYLWDFGDGTTSTSAYPSHTYAGAGTYVVCVTVTDGMLCTDTYCDSLAVLWKTATPFSINVISPLTSVQQPAAGNELSVSPNPFQGTLHVSLDLDHSAPVSMQLLDVTGRMVYQESRGTVSSGTFSADIQPGDLPSGIYFLRLTAGDQTFVSKVLAE